MDGRDVHRCDVEGCDKRAVSCFMFDGSNEFLWLCEEHRPRYEIEELREQIRQSALALFRRRYLKKPCPKPENPEKAD